MPAPRSFRVFGAHPRLSAPPSSAASARRTATPHTTPRQATIRQTRRKKTDVDASRHPHRCRSKEAGTSTAGAMVRPTSAFECRSRSSRTAKCLRKRPPPFEVGIPPAAGPSLAARSVLRPSSDGTPSSNGRPSSDGGPWTGCGSSNHEAALLAGCPGHGAQAKIPLFSSLSLKSLGENFRSPPRRTQQKTRQGRKAQLSAGYETCPSGKTDQPFSMAERSIMETVCSIWPPREE